MLLRHMTFNLESGNRIHDKRSKFGVHRDNVYSAVGTRLLFTTTLHVP